MLGCYEAGNETGAGNRGEVDAKARRPHTVYLAIAMRPLAASVAQRRSMASYSVPSIVRRPYSTSSW